MKVIMFSFCRFNFMVILEDVTCGAVELHGGQNIRNTSQYTAAHLNSTTALQPPEQGQKKFN